MLSTILIIIIGAAVAGFIQGLSGFAFGMVSMSFWVWFLDPVLASVLTVFGGLVGQLVALFRLRKAIKITTLAPYLMGGLCGIPLGVWLLPLLNADYFKLGLGLLLVIWSPLMLMSNYIPPLNINNKYVDGSVGVIGGVMSGIGGFSGVIPTLWCSLRGMEKEAQRNIIQSFNLIILTATMAFYLVSGTVSPVMLPLFAVVLPAMLIPTLFGIRLYHAISEKNFRRVVIGLLGISGVVMLLHSFFTFYS